MNSRKAVAAAFLLSIGAALALIWHTLAAKDPRFALIVFTLAAISLALPFALSSRGMRHPVMGLLVSLPALAFAAFSFLAFPNSTLGLEGIMLAVLTQGLFGSLLHNGRHGQGSRDEEE